LLADGTPAIDLAPAQIVSTLAVGPTLKTPQNKLKNYFQGGTLPTSHPPITVM
jgi:hypothetical protein